MNKKLVSIFVSILLFATASGVAMTVNDRKALVTSNLNGDTLYVGGNGPGNYTTIQEAINDASNGDTVFVYDDSSPYLEHIEIDKSITLKGENKETTIICNEYEVVTVSADGVNISGFTVQNSGVPYHKPLGIRLFRSKYTSISGNIIRQSSKGIYLYYSSYNIITDNIVTNNTQGIYLHKSPDNTVTENTFESNGITIAGDSLFHWNTHIIEDNMANGRPIQYYKNTNDLVVPTDTGQLILANCTNFTIQNLDISDVDNGIQLGFSSYNTLINNNIINNNDKGISLRNSSNNTIIGNTITDNQYGICLGKSSHNEIIENDIVDNYRGIKLGRSDDNIITGNIIGNNTRALNCGIHISKSGYNTIINNTISNHVDFALGGIETSTPAGIRLSFSSHNIVTGNNITENNHHGIYLHCSDNNSITGNIIINYTDMVVYLLERQAGIYLYGSCHNDIVGNTIANNSKIGIFLRPKDTYHRSERNNIVGNMITNNSKIGIYLYVTKRNNVTGNTVTNNNDSGIQLDYSHYETILGNTIINNNGTGIKLTFGSSNNGITGNNIINNNHYGIYLKWWLYMNTIKKCRFNSIFRNNITGNNDAGIYLWVSSDNEIIENNITNNDHYGIYKHGSKGAIFIGNIITGNNDAGIYLWQASDNDILGNNITGNYRGIIIKKDSDDNLIYHNNFINNTLQNAQDNCTNIWNVGYPSGGNYWDDYEEKYPDAHEIDDSGIWDTPYDIPDGSNKDNYPLMSPSDCTIRPLRADAHGPYADLVNESITFNGSASGGTPPYTWLWDFGDGDTSDEQNTTHEYTKANTYTVTLTVIDNVNSIHCDITTATIREEALEEHWNKTFGGTDWDGGWSVQQTYDGGYIITGGTGGDVWLIKTDVDGNELWNKTFGGTKGDVGYSVDQTTDGGYIITGHTMSYAADFGDVWLIKTDADGDEMWNKTFGVGAAGDNGGSSVQQTSDGGYIITGFAQQSLVDTDVLLIKTDENGNEQWIKVFGGDLADGALSVNQTTDGGYIITGSTKSYAYHGSGIVESDVWLIKTDANGSKQWDKTFGRDVFALSLDDVGYSGQQTLDGGYIVTGFTSYIHFGEPRPNNDVWLIKTDANGSKQWDKTFGDPYLMDRGKSVQQTSDGGYIITGNTGPYEAGGADVWLIKTDADGIMQWNKTLGLGGKSDVGYSVQQTSYGGYIVTGCTYSYGAGKSDVWLIKIGVEDTPKLEMGQIKGGFGVKTVVKNVGGIDASDVEWSVVFDGGIILLPRGGVKNGSIESIPAGEEKPIKVIPFGIGLGLVTDLPTINLTASIPYVTSVEGTITARIFGPFVILQREDDQRIYSFFSKYRV